MRQEDTAPPKERLLGELTRALDQGSLCRLTLGAPCGRDPTLERLVVRPVVLRQGPCLSFVWRHATRDVTKNHAPAEALARIGQLLGSEFGTAHLETTAATLDLDARPGRPPRLSAGKPCRAAPPPPAHDRQKNRPLDPRLSSWLATLGVTNAEGRARPALQGKLRQIQRFVEVMAGLLRDLPHGEPLELVDMGCGKGYLTFAVADWLRAQGIAARLRGVEARAELVDAANAAAQEHGFTELAFEVGTIDRVAFDRVDVLVALHACDTATDDALAKGIAARAALIVVAPCCHQELRPQLVAPAPLASALQHGILLTRHAELVTDALRAALLEHSGYATKVFEFVATEHTAKNLMITAVRRRGGPPRPDALAAVRGLAGFHGVRQQCLAAALGVDLVGSG